MRTLLYDVWIIVVSLGKGLLVTARQMFSRTCTVQYPEQRLIWPPRSRGRLVMPIDSQTGNHRCTACLICQRICPNGSIEINVQTLETGKKVLEDYHYHWERCTFCGLCVESCPFDALRLSHEHEIAVEDKAQLQRHLQTGGPGFDEKWQGGLPAKKDQELSHT